MMHKWTTEDVEDISGRRETDTSTTTELEQQKSIQYRRTKVGSAVAK